VKNWFARRTKGDEIAMTREGKLQERITELEKMMMQGRGERERSRAEREDEEEEEHAEVRRADNDLISKREQMLWEEIERRDAECEKKLARMEQKIARMEEKMEAQQAKMEAQQTRIEQLTAQNARQELQLEQIRNR
jgi:hypothetical protein